jgi:hypothetical protein
VAADCTYAWKLIPYCAVEHSFRRLDILQPGAC